MTAAGAEATSPSLTHHLRPADLAVLDQVIAGWRDLDAAFEASTTAGQHLEASVLKACSFARFLRYLAATGPVSVETLEAFADGFVAIAAHVVRATTT